jgi:hypothetical protein
MLRVFFLAAVCATAHSGTFTTNSVQHYPGGSSCSGDSVTQVLDSCTKLPAVGPLPLYAILTCAGTNAFTINVCASSDCSLCAGASGSTLNCFNLPVPPALGFTSAGNVRVTCGSYTPLTIGLIAVAILILICCIAYILDRLTGCFCDAIRACLRRCRLRELEEAENLLAASSARARQLRAANEKTRADADAIQRDIGKLESELRYARLEAELREMRPAQAIPAPRPPQKPRGGAAAGAVEDGAYGALPEALPNQPLHWST